MHSRTAAQMQMRAAGLPLPLMAPKAVGSDPVSSVTAPGFGYITGADGTQWYYTQTFETKTQNYGTYYTKSVITLYDSNNQQVGQATVDVPEEYLVNAIEVYGNVTTRFFDRDESSQEFMVSLHYVTDDYVGGNLTYVYTLEGEKKNEFGEAGFLFDASKGWNTYQRLVLPRTATAEDGTPLTEVDVLAPPTYGQDDPTVEHTFSVPTELYNYSMGSFINCYVLDGSPYYVLSYYEKPYVSGYDPDTWEMVVNPDNKYIIKTYDRNYKVVDSLAVPIDKPDDAYYRFASFGLMSDKDLSDGYFTEKGKRAYVVTFSDYILSSDSQNYDFVLYDNEGNAVKTICENATDDQWFELSPVKGKSDQMAFLQAVGSGQQIRMIDLPSCETAALLPQEIDGEKISTTLDRAATANGYQYAVHLSMADVDEEGNTIARIAWYNPDLTLDHMAKFNIGTGGEYFTPLLNSMTLSPYLFDTDDGLEYVYIAKKRRSDSNVIDNVLEIADEDGTVLRSFAGTDPWKLRMPAVLSMTPTRNQLMVGYYNDETEDYKLDFFDLPLSKFTAGGEGTPESPYLVSTAGDLLQVNQDPAASYQLARDIDMSLYRKDWMPLNEFTGTLDGAGHTINNLSLGTNDGYSGLFSSTGDKAAVKNLNFVSPTINLTSDTNYAGVVTASAVGTTLSDIHVFDASLTAPDGEEAGAVVGGLAGEMSLYSQVSGSSFEGTIQAPDATGVGGIIGKAQTSTTVKACTAKGAFTASRTLGGIAGSTAADCSVSDSRAEVDLTAVSAIGGIVGENGSRAPIVRSQALGVITSVGTPRWGGRALGGIVGELASDWSQPDVPPVVVGDCVSGVSIEYPAPAEGEEPDATIHRIVGQTIANEDYGSEEEPLTEQGLQQNYALSTVSVGGQSISGGASSGVEGETAEVADLTSEKLQGVLGYAYGTTVEAPWKDAQPLPVLYFENEARVLTLDRADLSMTEGAEADLTASVYGIAADGIAVSSSEPAVVEAEVSAVEGHSATLHLTCKGTGTAVITVKAGKLTATCTVTAVVTGVSDVATVLGLSVKFDGSEVRAAGATGMSLYNAAGQLVASSHEARLSTSGLASGAYVVVAHAADGRTVSAKLAVK